MKRKSRALLMMMFIMISMFAQCITVFATDSIATELTNNNGVPDYLSTYFKDDIPKGKEDLYNTYKIGTTKTVYMLKSNENTVKNLITKHADEQNISGTDNKDSEQQNIQDQLSTITVDPDIGAARDMLSGFEGIINMVVSIVIYGVTIGMTLFTSFDVCYIVFPVFRNKCNDAKTNGTKGITKTDKNTGETTLRIITDEAQYAITAADTIQSGQNPLVIYGKKRAAAIIFLAILIFILLTGNISIFTEIALKLVSGILRVIQGV